MADAGKPAMNRKRALVPALLVVVAIVAVLGPLLIRAAIESRAELGRAELAEADSDLGIVHLGRAARWRSPLTDHDERARDQLEQIANEAELARDPELALVAWRELRGALLATRTWSVVDPEQLERANLGIVRGMLVLARAAGEPEAGDRWLAELEAAPATDGVGTRIAALLFALWGVTLIGFVVRGLGGGRARLRWAGANLLVLLGWLLMM